MFGKTLIAAGLCLISAGAHAQVYKCPSDGKIIYSDKPCASGKSPSGVPLSAGGYSVVPGMNSSSSYSARSTERSPQPAAYQQPPARSHQGEAFARSAVNPKTRQTVSTLLPGGGSISQREAHKRSQRTNRPAPKVPPPSVITHCAGGFCHDNTGGVYHQHGKGTTTMTGPNGGTCVATGSTLQC